MRFTAFLFPVCFLALMSCGGKNVSKTAQPAPPPKTVYDSRYIQVLIDGFKYEFLPYGFCGNKGDGSPHTIGVRLESHGNPTQEHTPLQIFGSRNSQPNIGILPFTKIDFRFQNHHAIVYLENEEASGFNEEGIFEWSGTAPGNQQLSVRVVCGYA